ncbi:MAG: tyrosine-type recombinase/integrase [Acidimicrobiales bacterium]
MAKRPRNVVALRPDIVTMETASFRFLAERDLAPTSRRVYAHTLGAMAEYVGPGLPITMVTGDMVRDHLGQRYATVTPATFNRQVATLRSFFAWASRQRLVAEDPTEALERRKERRTARQAEGQRAIAYGDLEALWGRKDIALREKLLWRLAYETAARASEILSLDVGDLDLGERSAPVVGKGGGVELLHWATGAARLLPRYVGERTTGPLFITERAPRVAMAKADIDPTTGHGRLSYRRTAEIFTEASGGHTLHQLRHSALTHYAEAGVDMALLKAKSRHRSLRSLERYVRPNEASVARLTAQHDRARRG